jgi:hypothetical protein
LPEDLTGPLAQQRHSRCLKPKSIKPIRYGISGSERFDKAGLAGGQAPRSTAGLSCMAGQAGRRLA